jgi:hypothetical protein
VRRRRVQDGKVYKTAPTIVLICMHDLRNLLIRVIMFAAEMSNTYRSACKSKKMNIYMLVIIMDIYSQ